VSRAAHGAINRSVPITLIPERGELFTALERALAGRRSTPVSAEVVINVALQPPNSLLHDGHRWSRYTPSRMIALTRDAIRATPRRGLLVHASYAVAGATEAGIDAGDRLQPIIDAALEAEDIVLRASVPACVVRLGYLYGPDSRDLRAYRRAFLIGRPYWAGPSRVKQHFLHTADAARALLSAARPGNEGRMLYATDDQPASFASFMDLFAHLVGNPLPLHLPALSRQLSHVVVGEAHMQMTDLPSAAIDARPRPRGFRPLFPTHRSGLREVVKSWR